MRTSSVPNFAAGSSGLQGLGGLQLPGLFCAAGADGQGGGGGGGEGGGGGGGGGGTEGGPYAFIKPSSADVGAHPLPSDRKDEWKDVQVKNRMIRLIIKTSLCCMAPPPKLASLLCKQSGRQ